jgi:hypothetical protein
VASSRGKKDARRKSAEADEWRPNWSLGGQFTPSAYCISIVFVIPRGEATGRKPWVQHLLIDPGPLSGIRTLDRRIDRPRREMLQQHPMDEHVAAADLAEEDAIGGIVEEPNVVPRC